MEHQDELTGIWAVALDNRSEEEKSKDYSHEEFIGGAITEPIWEEKTSWAIPSLRKQITSSSCGAQSLATILEAFNNNIVMSASPLYRFRSNFPGEGMFAKDIGDTGKNKKTTTETLCPSQNMTEFQMNAISIPDLRPYGISAYYQLPTGDNLNMDLVATAMEKGHGVIFGVAPHIEEWTEVPKFIEGQATFSHYVGGVPKNYLLHEGEKSAIINDSCNAYSTIKGTGQRILTESFLKKRCWAILCVVPDVAFEQPGYVFDVDMVYGAKGPEVKKLQEVLIILGFLKKGLNTGYFGTLTLRAVMALQEKYRDDILKPVGLKQANGKVLSYTRKKLNELCIINNL